jgi:dihydrodipicolinate synthase/N-acetylneuraminate lyase
VLELAMDELRKSDLVKIAGVCGKLPQAQKEAELAASLGYDVALLSLGALCDATVSELISHARAVASTIPIMGFYLQPSVGGRSLPYEFWRELVEVENVVGIKVAPFNRYQTVDVVRAVAASGRGGEIALYTGNDDHIILDLLSDFNFGGRSVRFSGGLLGQWAVWTRAAVSQLQRVKHCSDLPELLTLAQQLTDANAAIFDPEHGFRGCIPGINEILRRQGLLRGRWCLDPNEDLSHGQSEQIDRVCKSYPELQDNAFVSEHLDEWLG